jgi:hypothetical protein
MTHGGRDTFGNRYSIRLSEPEDIVSDSNQLTQYLSIFIMDNRTTLFQLRAERAKIQSNFMNGFTAIKDVDYHIQKKIVKYILSIKR